MLDQPPLTCIAPACPERPEPGSLFCRPHEQEPAGRRGGWVSAEKRRRKLAGARARFDASNISTRLWIAGQPPDHDLPEFDVIALCAQEMQPQVPFHGLVLRCPIPDATLDPHQVMRAIVTGKRVAQHLASGDRVLLTGVHGINRPALVASFALAYITRLGDEEIVRLLRSRRDPRCLCNPHFQHLVRTLIGAGRPTTAR